MLALGSSFSQLCRRITHKSVAACTGNIARTVTCHSGREFKCRIQCVLKILSCAAARDRLGTPQPIGLSARSTSHPAPCSQSREPEKGTKFLFRLLVHSRYAHALFSMKILKADTLSLIQSYVGPKKAPCVWYPERLRTTLPL